MKPVHDHLGLRQRFMGGVDIALVPDCCAMYALITSSVTLPLLRQK
jgi:hypothetical protein